MSPVEWGGTALLLLVIGLRTFSYPYFPDNSADLGEDDGYPYYARYLDHTGTLIPDYRRLPGYPLFLMASARLTGLYYAKAGYYLQGALSLLVLIVLLHPLRRTFGRLFVILLLGLLAAPNLWVRLSVFAFPDYLTALLSGVLALLGFRWLAAPSPRSDAIYAGPLLAVAAALTLLKPGIFVLIAIFAVSLVLAHALAKGGGRDLAGIAVRAAALVGASVLLQTVIFTICGSGALVFYRNAMHARIVTYLPPVADTDADRIVERAKAEISAREGQRMEDENFTNTLAVVQPAIEEVWWPRLTGRPLEYLGVVLDEIRRKHYLVAGSFMPFAADTTPNMARIPRKDASVASRVYRRTGFHLPGLGEGVQASAGALAEGVFRTTLVWATLLAGLGALYRRSPFVTLTLILALGGYVLALAFGIFIDGRYLLPFAPLIYAAQAAGLATFVAALVSKRLSPG